MSEHMNEWPTRQPGPPDYVRMRQCPHGLWHFEPASLQFAREALAPRVVSHEHACDGCCTPPTTEDA